MKIISVFLLFLLVSIKIFGQNFPEKGILFDDTEIAKIYITINADSLEKMLDYANRNSDHEYVAKFQFVSSQTNEIVDSIGFRLRGNTSRSSAKKSFKVSFNTFKKGRKFYNLEKLNLNGEHNDPSIMRSKLSFDLMQWAKVPASRANHVELYVNNEYKGLYMNIEHIDEEFVESRFGNKNGNLYKCLYPATLTYLGESPDLYKFSSNNLRTYDLKTNLQKDDYSDLAQLINILNNSNPNDYPEKLEPIFNVNSFLKYLVIEILTSHWDGYSYNKNNFYLYKNTTTDQFEFIPYDLDNTFGIDWFNIDWALRNIYTWHSSENRPLTKKILENQMYKDRFSFYMKEFLTQFFNNTKLDLHIDTLKAKINSSAERDYYRSLDYGWNWSDFNNSYTQALGQHVKYGLKNYVAFRNSTANSQVIVNEIFPIISNVQTTEIEAQKDFEVFGLVEDEFEPILVQLHYQIDNGEWLSIEMNDKGLANDLISTDHIYSAKITSPISNTGILNFYITATDNHQQTTREPAFGNFKAILAGESDLKLYINEFMASNKLTIKDNTGEYADWIEIYNADTKAIWLGDKYLSDNINNKNEWQLPNIYINPGEFLLFWADNETDEGQMHANFKLEIEGDEIALFDNKSSGFAVIDHVSFGIQDPDVSKGHSSDGNEIWRYFAYPTPGYSNLLSSIKNDNLLSEIEIYPNPTVDFLNIHFENNQIDFVTISISDISGKEIFAKEIKNNFEKINIKHYNSGVYFLKTSGFDSKHQKIFEKTKKIIKN